MKIFKSLNKHVVSRQSFVSRCLTTIISNFVVFQRSINLSSFEDSLCPITLYFSDTECADVKKKVAFGYAVNVQGFRN